MIDIPITVKLVGMTPCCMFCWTLVLSLLFLSIDPGGGGKKAGR